MATEKVIYLKVSRKKHIIWVRALKNLRLPTQLIILLDFWATILKIAHPVNYSYLLPCSQVQIFAKTCVHTSTLNKLRIIRLNLQYRKFVNTHCIKKSPSFSQNLMITFLHIFFNKNVFTSEPKIAPGPSKMCSWVR